MTATLNEAFSNCWAKVQAAGSKGSAFKNITVCNYAPENINAYTVVLRAANAPTCSLMFYTDYRSPKVKELKLNNKVTMVMYSDDEKLQLIFKGIAQVHYQNETSHSYWKKDGYKGRRSYMAEPGPSTVIDAPTDGLAYLQDEKFDDDDLRGYENFAVVAIKADYLEYLQLSREGNRRAKFTRNEHKEWEGTWLIP